MASKRPIKSMSYRAGKLVRTGHAATLRGAIVNGMRRMLTKKIAVIEILDRDERVLATIRHISIHGSMAMNMSRPGRARWRREARTAK